MGLRRFRLIVAIVIGLLSLELCAVAAVQAQPQPAPPATVTPSVAIDPAQVGATPHWTITLGAAYCGGYRVGDGVYVSPEPPLALPSTVPDGSVLFSGQPAAVDWVDGALRVGPGPGLVQSMVCMAGQRPLNIELTPNAGFSLPADPGDYAVDVWTGSNPTMLTLTFTVPAAADAEPPPSSD
jgi:hypothetical protein